MYKKFFGFKESPFNLAPDPHFFYHSDIHREALARLRYGLQERVGFILVTGEVGSGKTTLINTLLEEVGNNFITACINNTRITEIELLRSILREFDIETALWNKSELIKLLNNFLIEKHTQGYNVVLIIDESQNLTLPVLEEVRLLSNLETKKEKLLQLILVGQPELKTTINRPELKQLNQRITVNYHITSLSKKETFSYINHRLKIAGSKQCNEFNKKAINRIYNFSKGIPRQINAIADNSLLIAYVSEKKIVTEDIIQEAIKDYTDGKSQSKEKKKKGDDPDLLKRIENLEISLSQLREDIFSLNYKISSPPFMTMFEKTTDNSIVVQEKNGEADISSYSEETSVQQPSISYDEEFSQSDLPELVNEPISIHTLIAKNDYLEQYQEFKIFDNYQRYDGSSESKYSEEFADKILNILLVSSIQRKVDSIFINSNNRGYKVRIRKGVDEIEVFSLPLSLGYLVFNRLKILGNGNIPDFWQENVLKIEYMGDLYYVNISLLPVGGDIKGVLSIQYPLSSNEKDFKYYGFTDEFILPYEKLLKNNSGIIIITGPQNSGKSKFLYTTMQRLDPLSRSIISFEKKITSRISETSQLELMNIPNEKLEKLPTKMFFQKPDAIFLQNEMEPKVLEEFLKLSSNFLIFLNILSDNLNDLIDKLHNITKINAIYKNILSIVQMRRLKSLCQTCKISYEPKQQLKELVSKVTNIKIEKLYASKGCSECNNTGYKEDSYIQRMSLNTGKLARYFKNKNLVDTSMQDLSQEENNRMLKDAFFLLSKGITSFDEVKKLFL